MPVHQSLIGEHQGGLASGRLVVPTSAGGMAGCIKPRALIVKLHSPRVVTEFKWCSAVPDLPQHFSIRELTPRAQPRPGPAHDTPTPRHHCCRVVRREHPQLAVSRSSAGVNSLPGFGACARVWPLWIPHHLPRSIRRRHHRRPRRHGHPLHPLRRARIGAG